MFLDPEPRNTRRPRSQTEFQGIIPPSASPIDQRIIRKPLIERSPNRSVQKLEQYEELYKPTVRLVKQTPSVATLRKEVFGELEDKVSLRPFKERRKSTQVDTDLGKDIESGLSSPKSPIQDIDTSIDDSVQSGVSDDLPPWKRRSISSSNFSNATTLRGSEGLSVYARSDRVSSGTTAREVSTLHDTSLEDLPESAEEAGPLDDTDYSATTYEYEESVAECQTIKPVLASLKSYETEVQVETPRPRSRRQTWSSSDSEPPSSPPARVFAPEIPPRISSMHQTSFSISSLRQSPIASSSSPRQPDHSPISPTPQSTTTSPVQSEASDGNFPAFTSSPNFNAFPSSPNFIAYDSSPTRPRSRSHPLRGEPSYESITSRLRTGELSKQRALTHSASWSSVDPASSMDTLPSIHVPRRRLRQVKGSHSLDLDRRMQDLSFSANLSTIASESERSRSRTASQQFAVSGAWPSRLASQADSTAFDEPGDMTLGLYREESAMPEPLFRAPTPPTPLFNVQHPSYILPPLPPMPHDFEEGHDTLADLVYPSLRLKRSGKSLRAQRSNGSLRRQQSSSSLQRTRSNSTLRHQRSQSTPLHSRQMSIISTSESERWSSGSIIFPTWVKLYYSGNIALASMSQISLSPLPTPVTRDGAQNGMRFDRFPSQKYQRSITATPTTVMTQSETATPTTTRHIVPAIFRPRVKSRQISRTIASIVRPESEDSDSMINEPVEPPQAHAAHTTKTPSPKRSPRKQHKPALSVDKPLPQEPGSQRQSHDWSRPIPHLAQTRRASTHLNSWRPPSFVESIDLIFKSRGHRQILFFLTGFLCPFIWMIGALMPLPPRPVMPFDEEKGEPAVHAEHTDTAASWREQQAWRQGVWWRNVNRVMSIFGLLIIGAVIAIAVVATR